MLNALIARKPSEYLFLAVTRNAESPSAKHLAAKASAVKLVEGDLNNVSSLFESASKVAGTVPIWGVYSFTKASLSRLIVPLVLDRLQCNS